MQDFLIGPSAAPCNGNIADGRIKWRYLFERIRCFAVQGVLVSTSVVLCNGNIADGVIKVEMSVGKDEDYEESAEELDQGCSD